MFNKDKNKPKVLASFKFLPGKIDKGYSDQRLHINLSENKIENKPINPLVKETFTGGQIGRASCRERV